jgi:hypothetical protein
MNEAITDNNPSPQTSSAFNMRVMNDEDSEQHLFIAETGSINGSNSLLLTSDILTQPAVKLCSQVPHEEDDDEDEDDDNDRESSDNKASTKYRNLQSSASKSNTSGSRNKRKNFQPRSIFMLENNDEDNNYEINSTYEENDDQSDNENDELINGKSSSESSTSSVCDSSEVQLQVSSHQQSIVTSITGIRRCASLQRTNQPSLQQSQPLDLSHQDNNGKSNGQIISDSQMHHKLGDHKEKDKKAVEQTGSSATSVTNPMDLSRKRSCSEDEGIDDEDESVEDEEVIDLRYKDYAESTMNELLGLYGLNRQPKPSFRNTAEATVTADYANEDSDESRESKGPKTNIESNRINFSADKRTSSKMETDVNLLDSLRGKVYDSIPSSLHSLFSSPNHRYSNQPPMQQNMASLLTFAALGNHVKGWNNSKESNSDSLNNEKNSWKQTMSSTTMGPAPWIDKSLITPSSSSSHNTGALPSKIDALAKGSGPVDYTRYVKRFVNAADCGYSYCKELNYREHFHCMDCNSRVFVKKEEMIRHFKWHKKRDESLQHGFMRYSPCDDCSDKFPNCSHNRKQTHYHCLKQGCDKVYISTSDVQMHANYHRKDSAIIQEGFQRFRATEDCLLESCSFYGQRTTHFHCRRQNCNHTFKNKADMGRSYYFSCLS